MFRRKQTNHKEGNQQPTASDYTPIAPLQFQTADSQSIYRFPTTMEQPLRHMVTRLSRDQQLPPKLAMVAALRHEGVSLISLALAAIMAHDLSRTICLVDLNWWWPNAFMQSLTPNSSGIALLLRRESQWDQALVRTTLPNLAILPAGHLLPEQRSVVARSTALKNLLEELSLRVDHLILDIPAILTTSDAIPLASLGDACCPVVQQGVSSRSMVGRAVDEVRHMPLVGVVMNRVRVTTPAWLLKLIPQE